MKTEKEAGEIANYYQKIKSPSKSSRRMLAGQICLKGIPLTKL
jgi:hypothetical protein